MKSNSLFILLFLCVLFDSSIPLPMSWHSCCETKTWGERRIAYDTLSVRFSVYHAVAGQTDDSPRRPADWIMYLTDSLIHSRTIVAVSPQLMQTYNIKWGDTLYVECRNKVREVYVHDITNTRYKNTIDLLVDTAVHYPSQIECSDKVKVFFKTS